MEPTTVENQNHTRERACGVILVGKGRRSTVFTLCCACLAFVLLMTVFFALRTSPIATQSVTVIQPPAARRDRLANPPVFDV